MASGPAPLAKAVIEKLQIVKQREDMNDKPKYTFLFFIPVPSLVSEDVAISIDNDNDI